MHQRSSLHAVSPIALAVAFAFAAGSAFAGGQPVPTQKDAHEHTSRLTQPPAPHERQTLPPSEEQVRYNLSPTKKPRTDLLPRNQQNAKQASTLAATPDCKDMNKMATYSGSALADYLVSLPDYECTYPLFSVTGSQAATIFSPANVSAVVARLDQLASRYNATDMALVNVVLYMRAAYYVASSGTIPEPAASAKTALRVTLKQLIEGSALYQSNAAASTTAGEVLRLVTNMHDEAYFLPSAKGVVTRFTNRSGYPSAVEALKNYSASGGFTGALTILFRAHSDAAGVQLLQNDISYANALNAFIVNNKSALLGTSYGYQLNDAANENFRFMQYTALKPSVKVQVKNTLATSTMTGADSDLWLAAADAVKYYDNANCAEYGTCNYEKTLADTILKYSKQCSPTLKLRAQDMTDAQMQEVCSSLATEEGYVHTMLKTNRTPVAQDNNTSLELVVFDDYTNYSKYAGRLYGISTDNGGMYLEGDPSAAGNQARFIAHEASWLRPTFKVWNLEHEYVHYLDGRFDMYGDFTLGTSVPTVWWIEGIAEYLSLKNNNQPAIDMARTRTYKLSDIFNNTYSMNDYVNRAYRWGYMATRFMMEKHRADVDNVLGKFRIGDYSRYQTFMGQIGTSYDAEFAAWADAATTAGEPTLPNDDPGANLPNCASNTQLGKNCVIRNIGNANGYRSYFTLMLPAGAKNLKLATRNGTGDVDMYVAVDHWPAPGYADVSSAKAGNAEDVSVAAPVANRWYYITLDAKAAYSGVSLSATYE
ncbi:M9 family metallopeptidase [Pseudoduganella ginsengisoli]|uniref:microbial collagenase n=1 Tax=Pseudoduganella ginsengisoli TaxID=1462440 RepID=A0A6L6PY78_9BURK|nr:M9 family metallopeptidase [Pseudoduganella ginsengisoli]MTW01888.1 collagenase [Pseudoduganella ginsengisoli]